MKTLVNRSLNHRVSFLFALLLMLSLEAFCFPPEREFYEIRIYHLKDKAQESRMDTYLQSAFIPALHKIGIKTAGVFKPVGNDTAADRRIYVFIPVSSINQFFGLSGQLGKDSQLASAGKDYIDAPYNESPYSRYETIFLQAFPLHPRMEMPQLKSPKSGRVYELRSYESPTEKLHMNKVKMFNDGGEINIFKRLDFNPVFYADVLVGSHMPNLMYMTTFDNKSSRDEHWKSFSADSAWKTVSGMDQYKNNVSKAEIFFLYPTEYSDI